MACLQGMLQVNPGSHAHSPRCPLPPRCPPAPYPYPYPGALLPFPLPSLAGGLRHLTLNPFPLPRWVEAHKSGQAGGGDPEAGALLAEEAEEEAEEAKEKMTPRQIAIRACSLLAAGALVCAFFSDPMVGAVRAGPMGCWGSYLLHRFLYGLICGLIVITLITHVKMTMYCVVVSCAMLLMYLNNKVVHKA